MKKLATIIFVFVGIYFTLFYGFSFFIDSQINRFKDQFFVNNEKVQFSNFRKIESVYFIGYEFDNFHFQDGDRLSLTIPNIHFFIYPWNPQNIYIELRNGFDVKTLAAHISSDKYSKISYKLFSSQSTQKNDIEVTLKNINLETIMHKTRIGSLFFHIEHFQQGIPANQFPVYSIHSKLNNIEGVDKYIHLEGEVIKELGIQFDILGGVVGNHLDSLVELWKKSGGYIRIKDAWLYGREARMNFSGKTALSHENKIQAALKVRLENHQRITQLFKKNLFIQDAEIVKVNNFLDALKEAQKESLELPILIKEGVVFLGPVPVAKLQPVL